MTKPTITKKDMEKSQYLKFSDYFNSHSFQLDAGNHYSNTWVIQEWRDNKFISSHEYTHDNIRKIFNDRMDKNDSLNIPYSVRIVNLSFKLVKHIVGKNGKRILIK